MLAADSSPDGVEKLRRAKTKAVISATTALTFIEDPTAQGSIHELLEFAGLPATTRTSDVEPVSFARSLCQWFLTKTQLHGRKEELVDTILVLTGVVGGPALRGKIVEALDAYNKA